MVFKVQPGCTHSHTGADSGDTYLTALHADTTTLMHCVYLAILSRRRSSIAIAQNTTIFPLAAFLSHASILYKKATKVKCKF